MIARTPWQIQKTVFYALFNREITTRFGGYRLGVLWALIEPLSHILVLTFLFSFLRDRSGLQGVPFPIFFATGILTFFAFRQVALSGMTAISANLGLFGYRQVRPFDTVLVRAFLESTILILVLATLTWMGAWFFDLPTLPHDLPVAVLVLFLMLSIGLGVGFILSVFAILHPEWSQLVNMLMIRPLYFISGVFFPLASMPDQLQPYLLWNPLLHGIEQFRLAWLSDYDAGSTSIVFLAQASLLILVLGFMYFRANRFRVLTS